MKIYHIALNILSCTQYLLFRWASTHFILGVSTHLFFRTVNFIISEDGCVSMAEFFATHASDSLQFEWELFNHFDRNNDGCIEVDDDVVEFHEVDLNRKLLFSFLFSGNYAHILLKNIEL